MDIYSASLMWDWALTDRLVWNNSARLDYWETDFEGMARPVETLFPLTHESYLRDERNFSYNSSLMASLGDGSKVRVSISRGFHIPGLVELARYQINPIQENYGNPNLAAESNWTAEVGYARNFEAAGLSTLRLSLFHQRLENLIVHAINPLGADNRLIDLTFLNGGDSDSLGLELTLEGAFANGEASWRADYTWMHLDDQPVNHELAFLDFETNQPEHKLDFSLFLDRGAWRASTTASYVSGVTFTTSIVAPFEPRQSQALDAYTLVNLTGIYRVNNRALISLSVNNLLGDHAERPVFENPFGSAGSNRLDTMGLLGFRYKF